MPHTVVHSINEKKDLIFRKYEFWSKKNQFSRILKFFQIFWSDLVGAIGVLEAVGMD